MHDTLPPIIYIFIFISLLFSPVFSIKDVKNFKVTSKSFKSTTKSKKMKLINDHLKMINKPFVKSIKSPDGDIIDCVLFHLQPAFDLPQLKQTLEMGPPEIPKPADQDNQAGRASELKQVWNSNGESCPNGTIPIRRTTANEIIASKSISYFGEKISPKSITKRWHATTYVDKGGYHGGKAIFNIWKPNVSGINDASVSQMWVAYNVPNRPINAVEAGYRVHPLLYGDQLPRLFTFWTPDSYHTGCYNLKCPGFVQTSKKVALGGAVEPISTYNGQQYDVTIFIWKGHKSGKWWLKFGDEVMGYWPSSLFPDLRNNATEVHYGGEVTSRNSQAHTSTQMGSGHFPDEGWMKAAYIRNLEVVKTDNSLYPASGLKLRKENSKCYDVKKLFSDNWDNYIYYGGPGYPSCQ